ncbi:hypothetical protein HY945_01195 [Candidatus Gottesmanbacteria bacterium]|nr:hypothetical protein [Candidatus Gottesmanbacteria bacterium]
MDKRTLLKDVGVTVATRIGRPLRSFERRALGFVIDQTGYGGAPADFLSSKCSVGSTDTSRDVAIKLQDTVFQACKAEYSRRLAQAEIAQDTEEVARLATLNKMLDEDRVNVLSLRDKPDVEISFYGVPGYWIPKWVPAM